MNNDKILEKVRQYEGRTVDEYLSSDICEWINSDIYKVNDKALGWGEEYEPDHRVIRFITIRNVMGYIITDIMAVTQ